MPHTLAFVTSANRLFDWQDEDLTGQVRDAFRSERDLVSAADAAGLFEPNARYDPMRARQAIAALPPSLSIGLHAAILGALERRLPVVVQWKQSPSFELRLWESVDDGDGVVGVLVLTPRASDLAAGGT